MKIQSTRYCRKCLELKMFEYNRNIGHSECVECGSRMALKDKKQIAKILKKKKQYREKQIMIWYTEQLELLKKVDDK